jgi:hypothetical protein
MRLAIVLPAIQLHGIGKTRICNDLYWQVLDARDNLGHLNNVTWFLAILDAVSKYKLLFCVRSEMSLNVAVSRMGRPYLTIGTTRNTSFSISTYALTRIDQSNNAAHCSIETYSVSSKMRSRGSCATTCKFCSVRKLHPFKPM